MGKLFLGEVNFGPVKQAISRQTQATGAAIGLAKTGLQIFNLFQDTKFSEFQGDYSDLEAEYQSKIIAGVSRGSIVPHDETGQIVFEEGLLGDPSQGMIPSPAKSLREDFLEEVGKLAEKYPRNNKVRQFVESTAQDAANVVVLNAQQAVVEKYAKQREVDFAERSFPQAVQQAIAQGNKKPLRDLIVASDWLGTERQEQLIAIGETAIEQGALRQDIRDTVRTEGLSAGSSSIQAMLSSGEISETQADSLRKVADDAATSSTLFWTDAARAAFGGLSDEMEPATAAREATEEVPKPYRAQARKVLIAERNIAIEDADREADEAFEDFYAKNAREPNKILSHLYGGGRVGMKADTFRTWEARVQSLIRNGGTGVVKSETAALNDLFLMSIDPNVDHADVRKKVVEYLNADRLTDDDARLYTGYSLDQKVLVSEGYEGAATLLSGVMKGLVAKAITATEIEEIFAIQGQLGAKLRLWFDSGKYSDEIGPDGHSDLEKVISKELGKIYPRFKFGAGIKEFFGGPLAPAPPELGEPQEQAPEPVVRPPTQPLASFNAFQGRYGKPEKYRRQGNLDVYVLPNGLKVATEDGVTFYRLEGDTWVIDE